MYKAVAHGCSLFEVCGQPGDIVGDTTDYDPARRGDGERGIVGMAGRDDPLPSTVTCAPHLYPVTYPYVLDATRPSSSGVRRRVC
jgi:hypothetical protein